ncbi:MAG: hypothetical protein RLN90_09645 [Balneolaceae bacterium]
MFLFQPKSKIKPDTTENYVMSLYGDIWNKTEVDRVYAWLRVLAHLKAWNNDQKLIDRANELLKQEQKRTRN